MKAAFIKQTGSFKEIQVGDLPMPKTKADEVLVRVIAVSVNYVDTFVRGGGFKTKMNFPFVIGRDAVGEVAETNNGFVKGQLVWTNSMGYDGRTGTTSEFVAIPKDRLFIAPKVDPIKLVASVHSSATAAIILKDILEINKGKKILIEGGAGHVGRKLVELANLEGLIVSTTSNQKDFAKLKQLGSKNCFDYHQPVAEIADKFDYIIDTSGKVSLQTNLDKLNLFGQIGLITAPKDNNFNFNVRQMYTQSQSIKGFVISHASLSQIQTSAKLLNQYFAQGKLLDEEILSLPITQAQHAHELLEQHIKAKLVLTVD